MKKVKEVSQRKKYFEVLEKMEPTGGYHAESFTFLHEGGYISRKVREAKGL